MPQRFPRRQVTKSMSLRPISSRLPVRWCPQGACLAIEKPPRPAPLLAVVQGLRSRPDLKGRRLILAARGFPAVPALFAAAIEPAIDGLYLAGGLVSFQSIVDTEDYDQPFGNFVPNLLLHTDLPELAASLAPRRVVLAGAVNGAGHRLAPDEVRKYYSGAVHVEVLPDALWDSSGILRA